MGNFAPYFIIRQNVIGGGLLCFAKTEIRRPPAISSAAKEIRAIINALPKSDNAIFRAISQTSHLDTAITCRKQVRFRGASSSSTSLLHSARGSPNEEILTKKRITRRANATMGICKKFWNSPKLEHFTAMRVGFNSSPKPIRSMGFSSRSIVL